MIKVRCKICGEVFEVESLDGAVCPLCGADASMLEVIE